MNKTPNRLIKETSPYLLQHAYNPVDWHPWGDEALALAKKEDKPILISIGYSACHWCHVMERESFEDEATAIIMNKNFINIKIDREERPDLDHIYMDAVQSMTGSGGWPLNVFLTPSGKPFYGGTYFPPRSAFNKPSWKDLLQSVALTYREKRSDIDTQAENLTDHMVQANAFGNMKASFEETFLKERLTEAYENIMKTADKEWGGFGQAPKFPQTFVIRFLLSYHFITKEKKSLEQALLSLDKMIEGGIYDQLGGGFARYATDSEWLAPHFEKMLYDNALLLLVLSEAYQLTKKIRYKEVINETMGFIQREMMHPEGGFYSALDADTEGEEGKFYVWTYDEVKKILKNDSEIFCEYYDVSPAGNWENKNILRVKKSPENIAAKYRISTDELIELLGKGREKLLEFRNKRVRPALDDKIILGWNALMNSACSKAYAATGNKNYRELAEKNMSFLLKNFQKKNTSGFYHTWKNDTAKHPAFLDDYAFLIQSMIHLQEITGDTEWLLKAKEIGEYVIKYFADQATPFFFYTSSEQKDVILRKKEIYDGAIPSGNSVMAYNLHYLSVVFGKEEWNKWSRNILSSIGITISRHPTSFGNFLYLQQEIIHGCNEIVITGEGYEKEHQMLLKEYIPHKIILVSEKEKPGFPLMSGKEFGKSTTIYLCRDNACLPPVSTEKALIALINSQIQPE